LDASDENKRYQSILVTEKIRAWKLLLVVTKVMDCDNLLYAGGKPKEKG